MVRVQKFFKKPSLSRQEFRHSCDVNKIVARFTRDYGAQALEKLQPSFNGLYGDFGAVPDLRTALVRVRRVEELFEALPANLRLRFDHSVEKFTEFCSDSNNHGELVDLGLLPKPPVSPTGNEEKSS